MTLADISIFVAVTKGLSCLDAIASDQAAVAAWQRRVEAFLAAPTTAPTPIKASPA